MTKTKVLFLCTGNSARSQMAEAFLRKYAGNLFEAFSAGLEPKGINPLTVRVMQEIGFDMSQQISKDLQQFIGKIHFGYMITLCDHAEKNCPIFPGVGVRMHWPIEDPAEFVGTEKEMLARFRTARDQIDLRIRDWLGKQGIRSAP